MAFKCQLGFIIEVFTRQLIRNLTRTMKSQALSHGTIAEKTQPFKFVPDMQRFYCQLNKDTSFN